LSFFDVPLGSRARQSLEVWGGKMINGWPLILRNLPQLFARFVLGQVAPGGRKEHG